MKVTFCAYDKANYVGGPNVWLRRLLPELRREGIDCRVLFISVDDPAHCPNIRAFAAEGIPVEVITGIRYTEDRVLEILRRIAENPPDVFVPNLVVAAYYAARWIRRAGIPTVGVLHSDDDFHRAVANEFVTGSDDYRVSAVACVSQYIESQMRARAPEGVVIARLPYGVPVPERSAEYPLGKPFRVIYCGRLVEEQKRISDLTRSFCRAASEIRDLEAVIYGEGPARSAVETILSGEGARVRVRLAGRVDPEILQSELPGAHAFALLSEYEGLSIALMEAMAAGIVPLCLSMRSGVPELVDDGLNGLIVEDRGTAFVAALARLRHDQQLWRRLSEAARAKIKRNYSVEACTEGWIRFFKKIARRAPKAEIKLPKSVDLPPVSAHFAREDRRREPRYARFFNKMTDRSRWIAQRLRDRITST